jgi:hypothetical protein
MSSSPLELQARAALDDNRLHDAEQLARRLLAGGDSRLPVWAILAVALRRQGRIEEACRIQDAMVTAAPANLTLRFELSETLLLRGDFDRGWREYQHRYGMAHTIALGRPIQRPRWNGKPQPGKTILVHDEQGFGDTFQFLRLVPWLKQRSQARIVLQIAPEQVSFARRMAGVDEVVLRGAVPPDFHMYCELMSLPMLLGLQLADLPGPIPYLGADPARVQRWQQRLSGLPRPLVALVWAGRPNHPNDSNRSVSLDMLGPLARSGATFLSVQKGPKAAAAQTPPAGMSLVDLDAEIADFDDTAAILMVADQLISVDSSPVHLAGALGRPAWVMLPFVPDWRWLMGRDDTPWYPSLRLFRQSSPGEWTGVIESMAAALTSLRFGS